MVENECILLLRSRGWKIPKKAYDLIPKEKRYKGTMCRVSELEREYHDEKHDGKFHNMEIRYQTQHVYPCSLQSFTKIINNLEWYGDATERRTEESLKETYEKLLSGKVSAIEIHGDETTYYLFPVSELMLFEDNRINEYGCSDPHYIFNALLIDYPKDPNNMFDKSKVCSLSYVDTGHISSDGFR
jgi:hypothetical protein